MMEQPGADRPPFESAERCLREGRAGRIEFRDPEPAARMLMGAAMNHAFFRTSGIPGHDRMEEKEYAEGVVQTLLEGIRVSGRAS